MSSAGRVQGLWRRGQRGWPERYPLAQLPNAPLLLAMGAGLVAARTDGPTHTGARATSHAAFSVWAWKELTGGANVVRRAVGAGALAYIGADIEHRAEGHRSPRDRQPTPGPPSVPGAEHAASLLFGTLARLRANRALHPHGVVLKGTFHSLGSVTATALLGEVEERPALVRISRGGGLPDALPDVLGCAIRVLDAYGPGQHQDFALASSLKRPVGRHVLIPARNFLGAFYSSILPYRLGSETQVLGAELSSAPGSRYERIDDLRTAVAAGDAVTVTLMAASPLGSWEPVATVRAEEVATTTEERGVRFNPWTSGGGIAPVGFLNGLRDPAYRASQAASPGS